MKRFRIRPALAAALSLGLANVALRASSTSPAVKNGQQLYAQSCASCHEAHSTIAKVGPGLKGYYRTHRTPPADTNVRTIIARGKGTMPGFPTLSPVQMKDLLAYLRTL